MRRNGLNEADRMMVATALYNNRMVTSPAEDCEPNFKFLSSWVQAEDHRKFMNANDRTQDKRITVAPISDEVENVSSTPDTRESDHFEATTRLSRPIG